MSVNGFIMTDHVRKFLKTMSVLAGEELAIIDYPSDYGPTMTQRSCLVARKKSKVEDCRKGVVPSIDFTVDWRHGKKFQVAGNYPQAFYPSSEERPSAGFSVDRDIAQVAKAAISKVWKPYLEVFEKVTQRRIQAENQVADNIATAKEFAKILGVEYRDGQRDQQVYYNHHDVYLNATINDKSVYFQSFSMDRETAREVFSLIAKINGKRSKKVK